MNIKLNTDVFSTQKTGGLMLHSCLHAARCIKPPFCQCAPYIFTWKTNPLLKTKWAILAVFTLTTFQNDDWRFWYSTSALLAQKYKYEVILFCVSVNGVDSEIIWVEWAPSRIIFTDFMLLYQSSKFLLANKVNSIDIFFTVQWEFIIQLNMYYPKTICQPIWTIWWRNTLPKFKRYCPHPPSSFEGKKQFRGLQHSSFRQEIEICFIE